MKRILLSIEKSLGYVVLALIASFACGSFGQQVTCNANPGLLSFSVSADRQSATVTQQGDWVNYGPVSYLAGQMSPVQSPNVVSLNVITTLSGHLVFTFTNGQKADFSVHGVTITVDNESFQGQPYTVLRVEQGSASLLEIPSPASNCTSN
jgi:hypothetical protein